MYGLWLYKELKTEYGFAKVEVFRKGYTASAIEIGALVGNSLTLALENLSSITDPIGKSVCSFEIYDTNQLEYDDLFTPDATAYKVVVSTKLDGGNYTTRWSGYVTPDFFAENLSYRTPISISARDNIGYLNDVDFDLDVSTITVRELIQAAFKRIAEDYPMQLVFATQKQTAEGILAIDATISTMLLREGTWYEALETILHDLGLQMRWVDNNTIAVLDLSQIPEYYSTQGFNFIDASGYREILPAWRELSQEQDYGVLDNFYKGQIDGENKLEYAANSVINSNVLLYQPKSITQWSRQGEIYFLNFFNSYNAEIGDDKQDSIYITGVGPNVTNADVLNQKMVYSQAVTEVDKQIKMTFSLNDTLRTPLTSQYSRGERNTLYLPYSAASGTTMIRIPQPYQLKYRFNIFLRANDGTNYVMRDKWEELSTMAEQPFIEFLTDKLQTVDTGVTDGQGNHRFAFTGYDNSKEYSITIGAIPKAGTLEFVVYPWTFEKDDYTSTRDEATFQRGAKITDIVFSVQVGKTGVSARTQVGVSHNIKSNVDYKFGQVPQREGDVITYAGGLFQSDTITALQGFQRNANATNYNLLELVGREIIHFNKKNYNKLSGTIRNLAKEPLTFNRLFVREGKKYAPFAYSLNVISNEMSITTMQEVEPYATQSFVEIKSELVTGGGATISGGNNTALQYSAEVGNAKRISELNNASESEKKEAYIVVDNASWGESKKVPLSEMEGLNEAELTEFLTANEYATQPWVSSIAKGLADDIANRVLIADFEKLEDAVDGNYKSISNIASTIPTIESNLSALATRVGGAESVITTIQATYVDKASAQEINGVKTFKNGLKIGDAELVWDSTNKALKIVGSAYVTKDLSFGGYQAPEGGGTSGGGIVTIKVNGQEYTSQNGIVTLPNYPSLAGYATEDYVTSRGYITNAALNGYAKLTDIPTSLPASDVYTWAKTASKPTYTASEVGALSVNGGTVNGDVYMAYAGGGSKSIAFMAESSNALYLYADAYGLKCLFNNQYNTLIHSGNIGSYTAGSATKLQTARSIWGQSFDGSGDVSGALNLGAFKLYWASEPEHYYIGFDADNYTAICNYYGLKFLVSQSEKMRIAYSGNVLIGTTTDWGFNLASLAMGGNKISGYLGSGGGAFFGNIGEGYGTAIWTQGNGNGYIQQGRSDGNAVNYNLYLQPLGGSVIVNSLTRFEGSLIFLNDFSEGIYIHGTGINYHNSNNAWVASCLSFDYYGNTTLYHNLTVTGDITFGSDARYKNKITDVEIDLATIANAPLFIYKWNDREDDREHLGTTAQYWFDTAFKNAVIPTNDEKLWTMSYSEIAIGNTIILAREQIKVKSRVQVLEEKVRQLEDELEKYRRVA